HLSLWPSQACLDDCGFLPGVWTHDNECWYQSTLQDIRSLSFKGRTSSEWKSSLRFAKKGGSVHKGAE
ncbi:hypothetical protein BD626DRAFT_356742, partial [Schizophyllum amplum]